MKIERLQLSIQTVKENIAILESQEPEDAGYYLQLEHEKMVLEALEKQIPKKPKSRKNTTYAFCPCCDSGNLQNDYCTDCGQHLDWSETEKESNEQFDKILLLDDRIKQRYAELFEEAKEFVRTEAIKEFAERLRKEVANTWYGVCCTGETEEYKEGCLHGLVAKKKHYIGAINNLLTEMVGGENANK